jgi:D-beta-D-heptose 7-phosphate kinase/D-beta-D-heptose 1-phosphate adenosyltransferase
MGQIISQNRLIKIRESLRKQGKVVVFTNGCFDIIHRGHVEYLAKAKKLGDILIIGLNSDKSVQKLKGPGRPIIKMPDRAIVLSHLDMVDYIVEFGAPTPRALIGKLLPDILVKGGDYRASDVVGAKEVKTAGGKVVIIPFVKGRSSTKIISDIMRL